MLISKLKIGIVFCFVLCAVGHVNGRTVVNVDGAVDKVCTTTYKLLSSPYWDRDGTMWVYGNTHRFIKTMRRLSPESFQDYPEDYNCWANKSKIISRNDIFRLHIWNSNNAHLLSWFLYEDMQEALFYSEQGSNADRRLLARLEYRKAAGYDNREIADSVATKYLWRNVMTLQHLFTANDAGYVPMVRLYLETMSFINVINQLSDGEISIDLNNLTLSRECFEMIKDWCYVHYKDITFEEIERIYMDEIMNSL